MRGEAQRALEEDVEERLELVRDFDWLVGVVLKGDRRVFPGALQGDYEGEVVSVRLTKNDALLGHVFPLATGDPLATCSLSRLPTGPASPAFLDRRNVGIPTVYSFH